MTQLFQLFQTSDLEDDIPSQEDEDYRIVHNLARATEHFVAADILEKNWGCSIAAEGLRYDLIAEIGKPRRIQVKMCQRPVFQNSERGNLFYKFGRCSRGKRDHGRGTCKGMRLSEYQEDIDLFAFMAFDKHCILYMLPEQIETSSLKIRSSEFTSEKSKLSWELILREWGIG